MFRFEKLLELLALLGTLTGCIGFCGALWFGMAAQYDGFKTFFFLMLGGWGSVLFVMLLMLCFNIGGTLQEFVRGEPK